MAWATGGPSSSSFPRRQDARCSGAHYRAFGIGLADNTLARVTNVVAGPALLYAELGQTERAAELLGLAKYHPATESQSQARRIERTPERRARLPGRERAPPSGASVFWSHSEAEYANRKDGGACIRVHLAGRALPALDASRSRLTLTRG